MRRMALAADTPVPVVPVKATRRTRLVTPPRVSMIPPGSDTSTPETDAVFQHMSEGVRIIDGLRDDHEALRTALFGADRYRPAGILGDLTTNVAKLQTSVAELPETIRDTIREERSTRSTHKFATWQRVGIIGGVVFGLIMSGGTVYEVMVGLSHSILAPTSTTPVK